MIEVVLLIQSGDTGPIRLVGCAMRGIKRKLATLQDGSPELLHIRDAIRGDERTKTRLHMELDPHYRARGWYEPAALHAIGDTFIRHDIDENTERQRIASINLDEILRLP